MSVIWKQDLATYDYDRLTKLVFLCLEARNRCDIAPAGPRMLRLSFWQRDDGGDLYARHPNLDEAVERFREYLPKDHRIIYREKHSMCDGCGLGDVRVKTHHGRQLCGACGSYNVTVIS